MAPQYNLTYFDISGIGEAVRLLFSYGGIEFTEVRIPIDKTWPTRKAQFPFGTLPILEHDGKLIYQSTSICRYLAKKVKLTGSSEWEDLEIDATADTIVDLRTRIQKWYYEADPTIKESLKGPVVNEILPFFLPKLDAQVKNNGGHFVGGKLTWADIFFVGNLKYFDDMLGKDNVADYPNLRALKQKVWELPSLKAYLKKAVTKY